MMASVKQKATIAAIWSFLERISTQLVGFIIGIILARLLSPHDYGVVGLIAIFISLSNVFIDSGFANALVRKLDRTEKDLSTAFYFNICVGLIAYVLLWITSPFIADFFDEPQLTSIVKIVGLNVVFSSLCIVQTAILTANLNIRLQTIINVVSQVPAGIIAIILAYYGFGVYALAVQTVLSQLVRTMLLWYYTDWRPKEKFDKSSFEYLWGFGSKLLYASLLGTAFGQIYSILIGKFIGVSELGFYSKSSQLNNNVNNVTRGIVQKIGLPVLSQYQNDLHLLEKKYSEVVRLLVMCVAPISAVLCIVAKDLIVLIWTDKWIECVILFQLLITSSMFEPIGQLSLSLFQVLGRTDVILKLEIPKKTIYAILIAIGFCYGIMGLCAVQIIISATEGIINIIATKKYLGYSVLNQLRDIYRYMLLCYPFQWLICTYVDTGVTWGNIILKAIIVAISYIGLLLISRDSIAIRYGQDILNKVFKQKKIDNYE